MNMESPTNVDFSAVAAAYDATRFIPESMLDQLGERLVQVGVLPPAGAHVLEVGCGTGQILALFDRAGAEVAGVDISAAMLAIARERMHGATLLEASAYDLPFSDKSQHIVVASKLFQHLEDWPTALREMRRVLRPGGHLVHVRDRGIYLNAVRRQFAAMADARGHIRRYAGMQQLDQLPAEATRFGLHLVPFDAEGLTWTTYITYGEALDQIRRRLFAEFWAVPEPDYDNILGELVGWIATQPEGTRHQERRDGRLAVEVYRNDAG